MFSFVISNDKDDCASSIAPPLTHELTQALLRLAEPSFARIDPTNLYYLYS